MLLYNTSIVYYPRRVLVSPLDESSTSINPTKLATTVLSTRRMYPLPRHAFHVYFVVYAKIQPRPINPTDFLRSILHTHLSHATLLCYLTVLPYCVIAAEGEGPTRDKHLRQLVAATLRGRAFELRNAVQIDHNSVAPQRHGHAQVADIVAKQGTAKYGKLNMGGLVESKVPYDIEAMLARW